jgi:putative tryptophan/tyrosine transport system substrate-binding protein
MKRREFIRLLSTVAVAIPHSAFGQVSAKIYHVATITPGPPRDEKSPTGATLLRGLKERGYDVGKNLRFSAFGARGQVSEIPRLIEQMKKTGVDVVVTSGYPTAFAAKESGIPVVIATGGGDPVATGLVKSLAHPGGTVTGISDDAATISTKRLSLLKQLLPNMQRVAMLWNRDDLGMTLRYGASAKAAQILGVVVQELGVREPDDFNGVFESMNRDPPDAILMVSDVLTLLNRKRVIDYAAAKRIPAIYEEEQFVRDGGLMSYGADAKESFERAADLVTQIFKGAPPSDIPFERPTRYPFVVNLTTAKSIGLEMPPTLVALADEVIE